MTQRRLFWTPRFSVAARSIAGNNAIPIVRVKMAKDIVAPMATSSDALGLDVRNRLRTSNSVNIEKKVYELLREEELQVIIATGGTGVDRRDITVETIYPILEKKLDGFGELFRFLTYQEIGTGSIMSRAIDGVARGKVILCLPGSAEAVNLAIDKIILPELGHLVMEATK